MNRNDYFQNRKFYVIKGQGKEAQAGEKWCGSQQLGLKLAEKQQIHY
jgi:hypothetical protein